MDFWFFLFVQVVVMGLERGVLALPTVVEDVLLCLKVALRGVGGSPNLMMIVLKGLSLIPIPTQHGSSSGSSLYFFLITCFCV